MMNLTKISPVVILVAMWLSLTSMTALNACTTSKSSTNHTTTTQAASEPSGSANGGEVVLGAARTDQYVPLLKGKRVALLSNQTGMVGDKHTLDLMLENGVNVVTIFSPGWIETRGMTYSGPDAIQQPAGRVGNPLDIASMVLFLCSPKAGFITGENICIDGGMTHQMIYHGDHGWKLER